MGKPLNVKILLLGHEQKVIPPPSCTYEFVAHWDNFRSGILD